MTLYRNKLYSFLSIACAAGYIWIYYCITADKTENKSVEVCLIKRLSNIPCPSCGSTRSVISLAKGNFIDAFDFNPLGYLIFLVLVIAPVWILRDIILRNNSLFECYKKIEDRMKHPKYSAPLIALLIINWIWNITKGV